MMDTCLNEGSRLGTGVSHASTSALTNLSNITLVDPTTPLQKISTFHKLEIDEPPTRSKLRLFAILTALYVSPEHPLLFPSDDF